MTLYDEHNRVISNQLADDQAYAADFGNGDWATVVLREDGRFHAVLNIDGETVQAEPIEHFADETERRRLRSRDVSCGARHDRIQTLRHVRHGDAHARTLAVQQDGDAHRSDQRALRGDRAQRRSSSYQPERGADGVDGNGRSAVLVSRTPMPNNFNCYPNEQSPQRVSVGIAVDTGFYNVAGSAAALQALMASTFATVNFVYLRQLNLFLTVTNTVVYTADWRIVSVVEPGARARAPDRYRATGSPTSARGASSTYPTTAATWHMWTNCFPAAGHRRLVVDRSSV